MIDTIDAWKVAYEAALAYGNKHFQAACTFQAEAGACKAENAQLRETIERLQEHVKVLHKSLKWYGRHLTGCDCTTENGPVCSCGLKDACGKE